VTEYNKLLVNIAFGYVFTANIWTNHACNRNMCTDITAPVDLHNLRVNESRTMSNYRPPSWLS